MQTAGAIVISLCLSASLARAETLRTRDFEIELPDGYSLLQSSSEPWDRNSEVYTNRYLFGVEQPLTFPPKLPRMVFVNVSDLSADPMLQDRTEQSKRVLLESTTAGCLKAVRAQELDDSVIELKSCRVFGETQSRCFGWSSKQLPAAGYCAGALSESGLMFEVAIFETKDHLAPSQEDLQQRLDNMRLARKVPKPDDPSAVQ